MQNVPSCKSHGLSGHFGLSLSTPAAWKYWKELTPALPSNQRILVGVAFATVGFAGLFWDRTVEEAELKQEEVYGFERVADEIAKRKAEKV